MIKITFLGTSSMVPTKSRNHTAVLLTYENENILIDCGEGTQRQFRIKGLPPTKLTRLLITHWHGDHILGIPGLIQTLGANEYSKTLQIYIPFGTKSYFEHMFKFFVLENRIKYDVHEVNQGIFLNEARFQIAATKLEHGTKCLAYSFIEKDKRKINTSYLKQFKLARHPILKQLQQGKDIEWKGEKIKCSEATILVKGKKITFIFDTALCNNAITFAKGSDLLVCEATYADNMKEKAKERKHLTAKQAAGIAKKANAKKLILTHFSQRYKDTNEILKEARSIFRNTFLAEDFMEVVV